MTRSSNPSKDRRRILKSAAAGVFGAIPGLSACSGGGSISKRLASKGSVAGGKQRLRTIAGVEGPVLVRNSDGYERWRQSLVWQMRKPTRYPEIIVRPQNATEIAAAVRFASQRGMQVAVKSGGHSVWCTFLRDGGMLIDLSEFNTIQAGGGAGVTRVGPALWARDLMAALAPNDQGFPVAHCASVPLGGYVTGGGLGLNGDAWGTMACFGVLGGQAITADGELIMISEAENEDLLWALRGGGSRFPAIISDFNIQTFDRSKALFSSTFAFPLTKIDHALTLLRAIRDSEPDNTELLGLLLHAPGIPLAIGDANSKAIVVRAQVYTDDEATAKRTLAPMMNHPATRASGFQIPLQAESYEQLFVDSVDWRRGFGFGRFAVDNAWTNEMEATVLAVAKNFVDAPSWKSHVVIQPKLSRLTTSDAGAFSKMADTYVAAYAVWDESAQDSENLRWIDEMGSGLNVHSEGHFINEVRLANDDSKLRRCYSNSAWERLAAIKKRHDPNSVFFDFPAA